MYEPQINWSEAAKLGDMNKPKLVTEPPVDKLVSEIVGKKIYASDPRLLKLLVKWKGNKPMDSMEPDNFLKDNRKIAELKQVLSANL